MYAKPLRNYQNKWWNKRNPKYQDCDSMGGDCTNYKGKFIKRYGTSGTTNILVKGYYD